MQLRYGKSLSFCKRRWILLLKPWDYSRIRQSWNSMWEKQVFIALWKKGYVPMKEFWTAQTRNRHFSSETLQDFVVASENFVSYLYPQFFSFRLCHHMDFEPVELQAFVLFDAFESIKKEYWPSAYEKEKYKSDALYWLGYFIRYISYTREIPSRLLYRLFDIKNIYFLYETYHMQSEDWCLSPSRKLLL